MSAVLETLRAMDYAAEAEKRARYERKVEEHALMYGGERDLGDKRREAIRLLRRVVRAYESGDLSQLSVMISRATEWLDRRDATLEAERRD